MKEFTIDIKGNSEIDILFYLDEVRRYISDGLLSGSTKDYKFYSNGEYEEEEEQ